MSYIAREAEAIRDKEYQDLKIRMKNITDQTTNWLTKATDLYTDSPEQTDRDDLLAMRNSFIANLRTALGV